MRRGGLVLLFGGALALGCPSKPPRSPAGPQHTAAADRAALTLPPTAASRSALARVSGRARAGDARAAWTRALYLIDLFDDARFARSKDSLAALAAGLGRKAETLRGARGTDRAIAALQLEVDGVLASERLHAAAQHAQTLLAADASPPRKRSQILQRMTELKSVARGKQPVSDNARLRLLDYCVRALEDARRAKWAERTRRAAHCLYPLYESDPAPYFSRAPEERPPPPRASALVGRLRAEIARAKRASTRHSRALHHLSRRVDAIAGDIDTTIAPPPDAARLKLPVAASATPYDWTPLLAPAPGATMDSLAPRVTELERAMLGDGRAVIALVAPATATGATVRLAAGIAGKLGAARLELVVGLRQRLVVPKGDYWTGRSAGPVLRAGVLSLSLMTSSSAPTGRPAQGARDWDPSRATLGLTLRLGHGRWILAGTDGTLATLVAGDTKGLRSALASVHAAYDYEQGIAIVPAADASYGHLVAAVDAAATDAAGQTLFPRAALRGTAPKHSEHNLATRIRRRARARVSISPSSMRRQTNLVRRCYQSLLEHTPKATATLRVQGPSADVRTVSGSKDANLRTCISRAMGDALRATPKVAATITLSRE